MEIKIFRHWNHKLNWWCHSDIISAGTTNMLFQQLLLPLDKENWMLNWIIIRTCMSDKAELLDWQLWRHMSWMIMSKSNNCQIRHMMYKVQLVSQIIWNHNIINISQNMSRLMEIWKEEISKMQNYWSEISIHLQEFIRLSHHRLLYRLPDLWNHIFSHNLPHKIPISTLWNSLPNYCSSMLFRQWIDSIKIHRSNNITGIEVMSWFHTASRINILHQNHMMKIRQFTPEMVSASNIW